MEWVEITAKSVEAAKERALDELGIDHDEAEFVVLEEPRRGLFNQLRGNARVRARVAPRTPPPKTERRSRRTRGGGRDGESRSSRQPAKSAEAGASAPDAAPADAGDDAPTAATDDGAKRSRRRRSSRGGGSAGSDRSAKPAKEEGRQAMTMTLDEQVAATESFLQGLLDVFGYSGEVTTDRTDDDNATVNVEGDGLGLLIGPRGQTMNAIQDLARISLQKQAGGSWEGHVHVDVNGYRAKRRAALVTFVEKIANEVREDGKARALEPMPSSDRKLVHDTVNALDGVRTSSEGHEPRRWVVIAADDA